MNIDDIIPYEKNARHNERAIPVVAESIREFGLKGQIVLESKDNPVIVAGHTRWAACKSLGWKEIPDERIDFCDDLTEEQIKAFRLADNRTGEVATWNKTLLQHEIKEIKKLDMSRFKFDFKSKQAGFEFGQERLKTDNAYNLPEMYQFSVLEGSESDWGIPKLAPVDFVPDSLMGFNYVKSYRQDRSKTGVHFFIDDYQFERIWRRTAFYADVFLEHQCVIQPDFSLYADMPLAQQIGNVYRNAFCAKVWQKLGVTVIPCLLWSTPESYKFCFDAIPKHSTVCVSTVGVKRSEEMLETWRHGMQAALSKCEPTRILLYGGRVDFDFGGIEVIEYKANTAFGGRNGR